MEWKFDIGDLVIPRALSGLWNKQSVPIIVVERTAVECSGGVQRFYSGRLWLQGAEDRIVKFHEVELEKYVDKAQA